MKKRYLFCIALLAILLFMPLALTAGLDDLGLRSSELTLSVVMDSQLELVRTSSNSMISDLVWQVSYNPMDTWQQSVLSKEVSPESTDQNELIFKWPKPTEDIYRFSLISDVLVKNEMVQIQKKVAFPISMIDREAEQYLLPTGNADSDNPAIIAKATELVSGQDDLSEAVFKLFGWVTDNIEYRRTDFTQNTAQSASWTLENRYGVCDELTNLLIALSRSVGIPARYISGIAYTNIDDKNIWEPHAWAELYFPGYGWVPFDPTYREYGYIDPTHVAFLYGTDSNQSSSGARWVGRDTQIIQSQLSIETRLKDKRGSASDVVSQSVRPLKDDIAFGSYTVIQADVRNPNDYYVYTDLSLVPATYFSTQDRLRQGVLLKPMEEKSVFWLVEISEDFSPKYYYTLPFVVVTSRNTTSSADVFAKSKSPYYSKDDMESLLANLKEEAQYHYSKNLELTCRPEKAEIYTYETETIACNIRNTGNMPLEGIDVCLDTQCSRIALPIARSLYLNFSVSPSDPGISGPGIYDKAIKARSPDIYKTTPVSYAVLDEPKLEIAELRYPVDVTYGGAYNLSCLIRHISASPAYNVTLIISNRQSESYNFSILEMDQPIILNFEGKNMGYGSNQILLSLRYFDKNGKEYTGSESATISLNQATFGERISLLLIELSLWLDKIFQ